MKAGTAAAAAAGAAVVYFYATEKGRARRAELKARATALYHSERVQDRLGDLAAKADENAHRLPKQVEPAVRAATSALKKTLDAPASDPHPDGGTTV